jgi:hypothetical protein
VSPCLHHLPTVLFLVAAASPGSATPAELTLSLPAEITAGDVAGWEQFEGRAAIGSQDIPYVLYVDPRFPAIFRLTRYQITVVTRTPEGRELRSTAEQILVWNSHPGSREPLVCYTLHTSRSSGQWLAVPSGSESYRSAMTTAISLYQHYSNHRQAAAP